LEFIDPSGLAALVQVRKQVRHAGGDVLLAAPQRQVLRLLTLTRLISTQAWMRPPAMPDGRGTLRRP
jgi:anti-anti-sigma factor